MERRKKSAALVGIAMLATLTVLPIALIDWPLAIPVRIYSNLPTPPPRTPWRAPANEAFRVGGALLSPVLVFREN
jgi:hypothetical protein